MKRSALFLMLVAAVGTTAIACGGGTEPKQELFFSTDAYETVSQLYADADLVVVGHPLKVVERLVDRGGDAANPGVPVAIHEVRVSEVLEGDSTDSILVATFDSEKVIAQQRGDLAGSREVVLFLQAESDESAPDLASVGDHYVVLGVDAGIFDISGGDASPRSTNVRGLDSPGARPEVSHDSQGRESSKPEDLPRATFELVDVRRTAPKS